MPSRRWILGRGGRGDEGTRGHSCLVLEVGGQLSGLSTWNGSLSSDASSGGCGLSSTTHGPNGSIPLDDRGAWLYGPHLILPNHPRAQEQPTSTTPRKPETGNRKPVLTLPRPGKLGALHGRLTGDDRGHGTRRLEQHKQPRPLPPRAQLHPRRLLQQGLYCSRLCRLPRRDCEPYQPPIRPREPCL